MTPDSSTTPPPAKPEGIVVEIRMNDEVDTVITIRERGTVTIRTRHRSNEQGASSTVWRLASTIDKTLRDWLRLGRQGPFKETDV